MAGIMGADGAPPGVGGRDPTPGMMGQDFVRRAAARLMRTEARHARRAGRDCSQPCCVASRRAEPRLPLQEASFREFCARPENRPMVEKTQQKEIAQQQRVAQNTQALRFRERFLAAPLEAQRAMAPFLEVPFLRRIVQTLTNDERGDFGAWATNPRIVEMLTAAKEAIDTGRMSEVEAERLLIAHAKARVTRACAQGAPC